MTTYRRVRGASHEELDGKVVVLSAGGDELVTLNEVGGLVWRQLDEPAAVDDIVEALLPVFGGTVARAELVADVEAFVAELVSASLVEVTPGSLAT